jgi:hypothetical protein
MPCRLGSAARKCEETTGRVLRLPDRTEADPRLDAETIIGFYTR